MTVAHLLLKKGPEVLTLPPRATLQVVIDVLATKHVGSVVIADTFGVMLGIISKRDVVCAIAKRGSSALDDIVTDYMTTDVATAIEADDIDSILQIMNDGRFRHMPITRGRRLIGIVSQGDAIRNYPGVSPPWGFQTPTV